MLSKAVSIVPGLYKIFDEILVNAADNKVRDTSMSELRVEVKPVGAFAVGASTSLDDCLSQEENLIRIWNNGEGVPIEVHKKENIYVPELIFGNLLTSSNFDDAEKKVKSLQMRGAGRSLVVVWCR